MKSGAGQGGARAMAQRAMLGRQVRRLRRERALSQVALARQLGISASYLNLIEHNQRPLTLALMLKLAETFDIDLQSFAQDADARLLADLREMFGDPLFAGTGPDESELRELVDAAPAAGRGALSLYRGYRSARDDVQALSERLTSESFLSTSPHELRTLMTSIRSFSEILMDYDDLEPDKRQQFIGILVNETQRLSLIITQMLTYASDPQARSPEEAASAAEEVSDFLQDRGNHFEEIEAAAAALRTAVGLGPGASPGDLAEVLRREGKVALELVEGPLPGAVLEHYDAARGLLQLCEALPPASRAFGIAKTLGLSRHRALFESLVEPAGLSSPEARDLACQVLASGFAAALLMPYEAVLEAAVACRYDIERLQARFNASFEQVCRRLATLNRPGARGLPFHFLRVDIAGNLSKRFTASGLQIARFGGVCPRMAVHRAFLSPDRLITQVNEMPGGARYFEIAKVVTKPGASHHEPRSCYAVSLGCELSFARDLIYADDLDLEAPQSAVPVGVTCRLCERLDCRQRAAPPMLPSLHLQDLAAEPA